MLLGASFLLVLAPGPEVSLVNALFSALAWPCFPFHSSHGIWFPLFIPSSQHLRRTLPQSHASPLDMRVVYTTFADRSSTPKLVDVIPPASRAHLGPNLSFASKDEVTGWSLSQFCRSFLEVSLEVCRLEVFLFLLPCFYPFPCYGLGFLSRMIPSTAFLSPVCGSFLCPFLSYPSFSTCDTSSMCYF